MRKKINKLYMMAALLFIFSVLSACGQSETSNTPRIPVLVYHSIMPHQFYYPTNADNPWILLDGVFYQQMRYLYENDFTPLTTQQFLDFMFNNADLPENPVLITFDDGYLDNYLYAAPIMREFGFTGIIFIITNNIEEETPAMAAYPLQFMSLAELNAAVDVFEYGPHGHHMHQFVDGTPMFSVESEENIRSDIRQSFDVPILWQSVFAYPFGRHSENAISALKAEGVQAAFATHWGYVYRNTDPFVLPRFSVTPDWTPELFSDIVWGRHGR
ncbi:MAG: polysaccharide deacetylase family protein [Defluviitaleaceae bacterium]|nr:polysaccharide deacetylase family protein [Defluviitaleaceae bacterium]